MEYLIGVDIGTTAVKIIIIDTAGKIVVKSNIEYPLKFPRPNCVEQDPEQMWGAVCRAMDEALAGFPYDRRAIKAISLSTQRDTLVCVDKNGRATRDAITWMDSRSLEQCEELRRDIGEEAVYDITGVNISTIWTFAFILWLRRHEKEVFEETACFGLVHDYILCRLGAERHYLDASNACQTMLYDYRKGVWSEKLMEYGSLSEGRLPVLVEPGTRVGNLSGELSKRWGLSGDVALVSGGGDQQCASLGAGAVSAGDVEIGIGTAANLLATLDGPVCDPERRMICHRAAVPGAYVLEGAMLAMGRLVEWLKSEIMPYAALGEIDEMIARDSKPGAGGLTVLPHFEGAACPYWNPLATGVFYGLRLSTTKADMARAIIESTAFEIRKNLDLLRELGIKPSRARISGGASKSAVWMQILADVLEIEVDVPENSDCAAMGAAILAGAGRGIFPDVRGASGISAVGRKYFPRFEYRDEYRAAYEANKKLYDLLTTYNAGNIN